MSALVGGDVDQGLFSPRPYTVQTTVFSNAGDISGPISEEDGDEESEVDLQAEQISAAEKPSAFDMEAILKKA